MQQGTYPSSTLRLGRDPRRAEPQTASAGSLGNYGRSYEGPICTTANRHADSNCDTQQFRETLNQCEYKITQLALKKRVVLRSCGTDEEASRHYHRHPEQTGFMIK